MQDLSRSITQVRKHLNLAPNPTEENPRSESISSVFMGSAEVLTLEYPIRVPVRQFIFWKKSTLYAVIGSCTLIFSAFWKKLKLGKMEKNEFLQAKCRIFPLKVIHASKNAKKCSKKFYKIFNLSEKGRKNC